MTLKPQFRPPISDHSLLQIVRFVVPRVDRAEWLRGWEAELYYAAHRGEMRPERRTCARLACGVIADAFWLRTESWNRALDGTAGLCLLTLALLCLTAGLLGMVGAGGAPAFLSQTAGRLGRFALEAPLVLLVTFATTSRRHVHESTGVRWSQRVRRQFFLAIKSALVLLLAFLVSTDLSQPGHAAFPVASDLIQTLLAVLFSIGGLRWAFLDQQGRCKRCLVALTLPAQVGRPSRNLLEWNGTEQTCRHGHGRLSSPELETSWCRHSKWLDGQREQHRVA